MGKHKHFVFPKFSGPNRSNMEYNCRKRKKIKFATFEAANRTALRRAQELGYPEGAMGAYHCSVCDQYHFGRNPRFRWEQTQAQYRVYFQEDLLVMGERVAGIAKQENTGTEERRLKFLRKYGATLRRLQARATGESS